MEALGIQWKPEIRKVADLRKWDKNPRKITEDAYARLKRKVVEEGMHQVLTIDTDNTVLSGNQRLQVLTECGIEDVWVMVPERSLTAEERDRVGIQANVIEGTWDVDMLANQFEVPMLLEQGFTKLQLGMSPLEEDNFDADKEMDGVEPIPQRGDIYQLGEHRLMCGDATEQDDVMELMNGQKARMLFTDPPYGVNYSPNATKGLESKHRKIMNDDLVGEQFREFLVKSFLNAYAAMTEDATFYSWFANSTHSEFRDSMEKVGFRYAQVIVWIKSRFVLSRSDYHHTFEPLMYGWKDGRKHFANPKLRSFEDVMALDVDSFADQLDVWFINRDKLNEYDHPTQKPIRLAERALRMNTVVGDIVLDLFAGSGSTLIGCQQGQRRCYTMEMDPKYVHAVIKRFMRAFPDIPTSCLNRDVDMAQFKS